MLKITKSNLLLDYVRRQGIVNSVMVRRWGLENGYIRSDRTMRDFAEEGKFVRRMEDEEIKNKGLRQEGATKIAFWEAIQ